MDKAAFEESESAAAVANSAMAVSPRAGSTATALSPIHAGAAWLPAKTPTRRLDLEAGMWASP